MRCVVVVWLSLILSGCSTTPVALPSSCDESKQLCYRGYVIDRSTTRTRFGVRGLIQVDRDNW